MALSVGSVTVDIVPDTRNFRRDLDAKLQGLTADVRLEIDDKAFKAELDEATRDRTVDVRVDDHGSINEMQGRSHNLLTTLALLAPAAAPLTAVAAGGAAALAGLGVAGLLALKGIQAEMASGSREGVLFSNAVGTIKNDLAQLESVAAAGVLDGVTKSAELANGQLPQLRSEIGFLSKSLGSDLAPVTSGILGLFRDLFPTVQSISNGVHGLAVDFEDWATGPGGVRFAQYLAQTLPEVEHTLAGLASAGAHVVQSLLPLGGPVLTGITAVSTAISHIPVSVIEDMFIAFGAYKTVELANAATLAYNRTLEVLGATAGRTAGKLDALSASEAGGGASGGKRAVAGLGTRALGALGPVGTLAVGSVVAGAVAGQALERHGAKIDNAAAAKIVSGGPQAFTAAQQQLAAYNRELASLTALQLAESKAGGVQGQAALALTPRIQQLQTKTHDLAVAVSLANPLVKQAAAQNVALGLSADGTKDAITGETVAMSKLITTSDKMASATQGLASANIAAHQAVADANTALKENGKTLDLNTQKGRDNRTALLNVAAALRTKIDAEAADGALAPKIKADTDTSITQLENMARKFGLSKTAAHNYALTLLGIPRNVLTTVTVNGIAKSEAQIAALKRKEGAAQFTAGQRGSWQGGLIRRSDGGSVFGAGTATSDSIPALLSNGEFVIKAATVKQLGVPFLKALNEWTPTASVSTFKGSAPAMGAGRSGTTVNMVVNPQPHQSETAIATITARRIEAALKY